MRLGVRDWETLARLALSYALKARLSPRLQPPASLLRLHEMGLAEPLEGRWWAATTKGRALGLQMQRPPAVEPGAEVIEDEG